MKSPPLFRSVSGLLVAACALTASVTAATLTLNPTADAFIRTGQITGAKNTTNVVMLVGVSQTPNDAMRGLLTFDLGNPALKGAKINNATLTLKIATPDAGSEGIDVPITLHPIKGTFSEGGVTWDHRAGSSYWTAKGGDFGAVLASTVANAGTIEAKKPVVFTDAKLTAHLGAALGASTSFLIKLNDESTARRGIFRFGTINGAPALQPVLTIDYTPPAAH